MTSAAFDVAILGSGFAASITALILARIGLRPVLLDKTKHPRFAIGESSTPAANMVLRSLATRYDLPRLLPLAKFGSWQRTYPQLVCGLKRGFSYFQHEPARPFQPYGDHRNELLVAASSTDEQSDTHWLRADIDQFLVNEVRSFEIPVWEQTIVGEIQQDGSSWAIRAQSPQGPLQITAAFLIDATGESGLLPRKLGIAADDHRLHTHSRAVFSHFYGVRSWSRMLEEMGAQTSDHPFGCDDAAQHQILDGAWVWVLRFINGLTSVGIVLDERRYPLDPTLSPADEWSIWLARYPSLQKLLNEVRIADSPGRILRSGRLQRCWQQAAGLNWALLPHTAGFIDPFNSSGIAQSLCGIERLVRCLQENWGSPALPSALHDYSETVKTEVLHIDRLVDGCFRTFGQFPLLLAYSMLFFAATTTYERRRVMNPDYRGAFLAADDAQLAKLVCETHGELCELADRRASLVECRQFEDRLLQKLTPYNHVGLGDRSLHNMYRHTVPE